MLRKRMTTGPVDVVLARAAVVEDRREQHLAEERVAHEAR
jgi:hypothetical protein